MNTLNTCLQTIIVIESEWLMFNATLVK
jgi:hypothetical protein